MLCTCVNCVVVVGNLSEERMMMKSAMCALVLVALVVVEVGPMAEAAVTCNPTQLTPCLPAINSGSAPSSACCQKLKEQKPCFCGYLKNPSLKQYVNSPNARKTVASCGIPFPTC